VAHSEARSRGDKSALGEGALVFRQGDEMNGRGQDRGRVQGETEDLTWGYKMPQGQLLILEIRQMPRRGT